MNKLMLLVTFLLSISAFGQVVNNGGGIDEDPDKKPDTSLTIPKKTVVSTAKDLFEVKALVIDGMQALKKQWKQCHHSRPPFDGLTSFHDYVLVQQLAEDGGIQTIQKCERSKLDCVVSDSKVKKVWKQFLENEHAINYLKKEYDLTEDKAVSAMKVIRRIIPRDE